MNIANMQNNNIGVLFDLDGVILDTEGIYTEFWDQIEEKFPTGVKDFSKVIKGCCLEDILNSYFPKENHAKIIEILNDFQKNMQYRYFPYAIEWVKTLYNAGIRGYFKAVIVGEMVENAKPAPDCFLLGAKLLGIDIKNCYIFEDSINGLKAAFASGGHVIALSTTNPASVLGDAKMIIPDFKDFTIEKMLKS